MRRFLYELVFTDYNMFGPPLKFIPDNGTRQSITIMGEHSFDVTHLKCSPGRLFILKLVFAQVQLTPLYSNHTNTSGGRI